jgi:hypothetical protein
MKCSLINAPIQAEEVELSYFDFISNTICHDIGFVDHLRPVQASSSQGRFGGQFGT